MSINHLNDPVRARSHFLIIFAVIGYFVFNPSPSFPYSLGGYMTTHFGEYNWNIKQSASDLEYVVTIQKPPRKSSPIMPGGGLVWDVDFINVQLMFRQSLGFEALISRQFEMTRLSLINTLAFVPMRTDSYSFWFGLQLNLHYIWGKDAAINYGLYNNVIFSDIPVSIRRRYGFVTIGTGFALGLDYNIHKNIKLSFETGLNINTSVYGRSHEILDADSSVFGYEGYLSVSVMYRFNEKKRSRELIEEDSLSEP